MDSYAFTGCTATEQYFHWQTDIIAALCRSASSSPNDSSEHRSGRQQKSIREWIRKRAKHGQQSERSRLQTRFRIEQSIRKTQETLSNVTQPPGVFTNRFVTTVFTTVSHELYLNVLQETIFFVK